MNQPVKIELTAAEALIAFEALAKLDEKRIHERELDSSERMALWAIQSVLEKNVPVFAPNYAQLVQSAKRELNPENL
ncbi:MAG: hypothetical protein KF715_15755 [Candidatus Didemnitutus sp.]|nr:hypothetical protein [Candidatus Didemnitutus sp.]